MNTIINNIRGESGFNPDKYTLFASIRNYNETDPVFNPGINAAININKYIYVVQRDTNVLLQKRPMSSNLNNLKFDLSGAEPYNALVDLYFDIGVNLNIYSVATSIVNNRWFHFDFKLFPTMTSFNFRYQNIPTFDLTGMPNLNTITLSNHYASTNWIVPSAINSMLSITLSNAGGTHVFPDFNNFPNLTKFYIYRWYGATAGHIGNTEGLTKVRTYFVGLCGTSALDNPQDFSGLTACYDLFLRGCGTIELGHMPALTKFKQEDCAILDNGSLVLDNSDRPNFASANFRGSGSNSLDPSQLTTSFKTFSVSKKGYNHEPLLQQIVNLGTLNGSYTSSITDPFTAAEQLLADQMIVNGWSFSQI